MKSYLAFCLAILIGVLGTCQGCIAPAPIPIPVPPEPPTPTPPPPPSGLSLDDFSFVELGAEVGPLLAALPAPTVTMPQEGRKTVYGWRLIDTRPDGGYIWWEVHAVDGKVVASFAW